MAKDFKRGIDNENVLNKAKDFFLTGIGHEIVKCSSNGNPAFQIGIRDNYFNIYWNGCSVLKYSPNAHKNRYKIHQKYVRENCLDENVDYLSLSDELTSESWDFKSEIIAKAQKGNIPLMSGYVKGEKEDLKNYILQEKPFLLDLEVAFTRKRNAEEKKNAKREYVANRIDMARIVLESGHPTLQLIEVKRSKDSRLRSENTPEIILQMERYQAFIVDEYEKIKKSYSKVAENLIDLGIAPHMSAIENRTAEEILREFAKAPRIDKKPYLLVIGDTKDLDGKIDHWQKLEKLFTKYDFPAPLIWNSTGAGK